MTVRINANSCKNALGTVFLLATAFFVCSTFISMRSVFADPVAPANAGIAQSGRQSPRSTSRTSDRTVSRSTTSRGSVAPTRTAVSRGGATRSVSSRSITPTRPATSTRSVAVRGNRTNTQSTNRTVRARTGSTQSRISASGSVMSAGSRASVNTTYSYLNSRLNTGNYSNIIDSTTGLISADAYANCMDSYYACMDEICTARSTTKGRCSCAGRATNFLAAEEALERANEELIILSGQLSLLISTKGKGDDLAAAFSLTDAEKVMNCVSWRDTYAKYKSGTTQDDNGNDLMEQWYKNHPTYNDASATSALTTSYTNPPYYCTNNNFGFDIGDIDGSSSDILVQLKAWADAKDLAKEFATDNDTLLSNYNSTMSYVVNKFGGITMTDTSKADLDTMANKWGYKLFEYAHNNVCGRVLDSCFNGIYEACGTPVSVKDSDGNTHSKCQNGATTSCPFNYNSYISVNTDPNNKKYGEVELHERDSSNTNVTSTASCFGYTTTTTTSSAIRATSATSTNDPYYSLRGPVADARRSIMQKYLLDANSACDVYGANLKTTAQNINYQKVAAEQALQQKRLEFAQQERSDVFSNYKTATNNFTECQSELWDCYETYAEEDNWTTARIKSYCSQPAQVPHCYEVMVCTPGDTSLQAVIDKSDSTECTFSTDYKKNTCRNIVTISEILYGTSKAPESSDKENDILGALEGKTEVEKVSSAKIREKCLRNALKSENGTGEKTDKYSIRGWSLAVYKEKESTGTGTSADSGAAASELDSSDTCTYTVTTCGTGYTRSTDSCTRNGTTYYKECIANTCDSGYNQTTTCTAGYDQETCQAGTTTKYKCTPKACTGFDKLASDTCPTGFHKSETTCLSGTTTKYKCVADVCDASAYQSAACGAGYDQETCQAGTTTMYKCTPKACTGYNLASTGNTQGVYEPCLSGSNYKYKYLGCGLVYFKDTTGDNFPQEIEEEIENINNITFIHAVYNETDLVCTCPEFHQGVNEIVKKTGATGVDEQILQIWNSGNHYVNDNFYCSYEGAL